MIRLTLVFCSCLLLFSSLSFSQTNKKIRDLKKNHTELQKQIANTENMLKSTKKDVGNLLHTISSISGQIEKRKSYINKIEADVIEIDKELSSISNQMTSLEAELKEKKDRYAEAIRRTQKINTAENNLMFILSAKDLEQTYRRIRYVKEYADYQKRLAQEIKQKQLQLRGKKTEFEEVKTEKEKLKQLREQERINLEKSEKDKRRVVEGLQKKQKQLQQDIKKKREEADKLNKQIDKLIAEEIEKAKKKAEEEERRKREERRRKQASSKGKQVGVKDDEEDKPEPRKSASAVISTTEDRALSGSFVSNKGRLPMPISGSYIITNRFGKYNVGGLRNVVLDNKGIDIQGQPGAKALSVFKGKVATVFSLNGLYNVLVRHGSYISVYCNLSSVSVKSGDVVSTRQQLGTVYTDSSNNNRTELHFQLRKETVKLNPEQWLRK